MDYEELNFNDEQKEEILDGDYCGLSDEEINIYANPKYNAEQMRAIKEAIFFRRLSLEHIKKIANPSIPSDIMREVLYGTAIGMSVDDIQKTLTNQFDENQRKTILSGFENGLTKKQMLTLLNPNIDFEKMKRKLDEYIDNNQKEDIYKDILTYDLSFEETETFIKSEFNVDQLLQIYYGLGHNIPTEKIKLYAKPEFNTNQMQIVRMALQNNFTNEQLETLMSDIKFKHGDFDEMQNVFTKIQYKLTVEQIEVLERHDYDFMQEAEILKGLEENLSVNQVNLYANPKFNWEQMKVMEEALSEWELPTESIKEFAIPSLSSELMYDAYYGIACGLSVEEVKIYTKSCYTNEQRNTILWGLLDGLSKDEINSKINDFNKNKKER